MLLLSLLCASKGKKYICDFALNLCGSVTRCYCHILTKIYLPVIAYIRDSVLYGSEIELRRKKKVQIKIYYFQL